MKKDTEYSNCIHSILVTTDMQKTILAPKLDIKDVYFSRKLVIFNETFAQPAGLKTQPSDKCVVGMKVRQEEWRTMWPMPMSHI